MIARDKLAVAGDALPRPFGNCYWLAAAAVLAGEHPGTASRLQALRAWGVTHFIDLTQGLGAAAYDPQPAVRLSFPITDFGLPTVAAMRATLDAIHAATAAAGLVYLHCRAGIGRTGTVAACLLVDNGYTADAALALLQRKWAAMDKASVVPRTPETAAQRAFVQAWAASVLNGA